MPNLPADHDLTVALAKCAVAAIRWHDRQLEGVARLGAITDAMAWAGRAAGGRLPARTVTDFLSLMKRPSVEYLPGADALPLVDEAGASDHAQDLVAELGDALSGMELEAEVVQSHIGHARTILGRHPDGTLRYRAFRRFLIDHPYATFDVVQDGLLAADVQPGLLYEAIPPSRRHRRPSGEVVYPCPRCRWPMPIVGDLVQCSSPACRDAGARFRCRTGDAPLLALGTLSAPEPVAVSADMAQLRRGVWRYTLLPGLVELALADRLNRLDGVSVELWPERDRYDLRIRVGTHTWVVDVKDWGSAPALARHLSHVEPPELVHIVVPAHKKQQLGVLRERCPNRKFAFCTDRQLVEAVRARRSVPGRS